MRKLNTSDVFAFVRLVNACDIKDTLKNELVAMLDGKKEIKSEDFSNEDGIGFVFAFISAFGKKGAEEAFYEFLSAPFEKTVDEIKNLPPEETLKMIVDLANPTEWMNFFKYAEGILKALKTSRN